MSSSPPPVYDRALKEKCVREILNEYRYFLNLPTFDADKRLIFFLVLCRLLDKANQAPDETTTTGNNVGEKTSDGQTAASSSDGETAASSETNGGGGADGGAKSKPVWRLDLLEKNFNTLFARYKFQPTDTEEENFERYVDGLLDCYEDTMARFV